MQQGRRPRTAHEAEFFDLAADAGWLLTSRGWPDFFLQKGDRIIAVEVQPAGAQKMRPAKRRLQGILAEAGIPCAVWTPDGGLSPARGGIGGERFGVGNTAEALEELSTQSTVASTQGGVGGGQQQLATPEPAASPSRSETSAAIDRVWAAYVMAMEPRKKVAGEGERLIIRKALREGSEEELAACIRTCAESDYHMKRGRHANRKGGKYNSIGKILSPRPRLGETQRSRIDWWLDRANSATAPGFPSADGAIVSQRQIEVQRGYRSGDPEMVKKAEEAEAWLAKHGIETVRRSDGYPTFQRVGAGDGR